LNAASNAPLLLALLVLLLIVAFSSGTEVAMLSVNRYRIMHRAQAGSGRARTLERLLQKPDDWLGANLVILAVASMFASAIATILAQRTGHPYAVAARRGAAHHCRDRVLRADAQDLRGVQPRGRRAARRRHLSGAGAGDAPGAVAHQQPGVWVPAPVRGGACHQHHALAQCR